MKDIRTDIIPVFQTFAKVKGETHELNLEAICVFAALGFFLDTDTYWRDQMVLPPASHCVLDEEGCFHEARPHFQWFHDPQKINLTKAVDQFESLFDTIVEEQVGGKKVILPLSGGLDSRTQAAALMNRAKDMHAYSYSFEGGYPESRISGKIAQACGYSFSEFTVPSGYLWGSIDDLAQINQCYSDFVSPRQMAFSDKYASMGEVFSLGHWGDVLFDGTVGVSESNIRDWALKKVVKKGGMELAHSLWMALGLQGSFKEYLYQRIDDLLSAIDIKDGSAKLRAFKSLYWAPRWTSINLSIFARSRPITLPYYDERICSFICTIPEEFLNNRQIQIEYIKRKSPKLAEITWQDQKPFNLNTYKWNRSPYNLPYRVFDKLKRELNSRIGDPLIQRNWELQFLGEENEGQLKDRLYAPDFLKMVPFEIVEGFYEKFKKEDQVYYSHPVSMLLTLSLFQKHFSNV